LLAGGSALAPARARAAEPTTGTAAALRPIVGYSLAVREAVRAAEASQLQRCADALAAVPATEGSFKSSFDAFSEAKSYLTEYKDKNAFVVYYTGGFDGPGRARLGTREDTDPQLERQSAQFGLRNDAWAALDEGRATLRFMLSDSSASSSSSSGSLDPEDVRDLLAALRASDKAFEAYLTLAPPPVVEDARRMQASKSRP
jgi:hypothetical protein